MERILRRAEVLEITGLSAATIYRWISKEYFPAPVQLGPNSVGWLASEVEEWIKSRARAFEVSGNSQHEDGTPSNELLAAGSSEP